MRRGRNGGRGAEGEGREGRRERGKEKEGGRMRVRGGIEEEERKGRG